MKKILVCDDEESILEVIEIILTENGYQVKTISNCETILEGVKDFEPDLILLDLWMRTCDGREVAKKIKNLEKSETSILFISALNELDEISQDANVAGFIKKPFEIEELLASVESAISRNE